MRAPEAIEALNFVADVIEAGGRVCSEVTTAGGGNACRVHWHSWPCPVQHTVSRAEIVSALRQLALERDAAASSQEAPKA